MITPILFSLTSAVASVGRVNTSSHILLPPPQSEAAAVAPLRGGAKPSADRGLGQIEQRCRCGATQQRLARLPLVGCIQCFEKLRFATRIERQW
jgi:hypothetical protein